MDYKEIEKRQYDEQQMVLNPDGSISKNPLKCAKKIDNTDYTILVFCPFCLEQISLWKFKLVIGFRICPNCQNKMLLKTLTTDMSAESFAQWVYNYRLNGFFSKIFPDFETWNKKLYALGLSHDFWEEYKKLKGENEDY
jgi:hypothetical protein